MKKIYLILLILLFPIFVHSETVSVCQNGCDYNNLDSALDYGLTLQYAEILFADDKVYSITKDYDFGDGGGVLFESCQSLPDESNSQCNSNTVNIKGNGHTIRGGIILLNNDYNMLSSEINDEIIANLSKNAKFNIQDITIQFLEMLFKGGTYNFNNCSLKPLNEEGISLIGASLASAYIYNSYVETTLMPGAQIGGPGINAKFYLDDTNTYKNTIKRARGDINDENSFNDIINLAYQDTYFAELEVLSFLESMGEEFTEITDKSENEIYYTQTKDKTIKNDTSITESEKEFTNTYIDSYGFTEEEINAPVVWTSEDESIAKISNGVITPIKPGTVVLTGTRNHDIYKINLTVEKETIAEKIEDKTIEIPPAGIKIKVWVLVAIILLFGVVGVIIYLLIKNKKSK